MDMEHFVEMIVIALEASGIAVIVLGTLVLVWRYATGILRGAPASEAYHVLRRNLGRVILLGLEFLVAADIINTVSVRPSFQDLGVLGLLVVIRTFLSFALEIEINGRLPWKMGSDASPGL
ncbi:protein of unknown function DUF1622 [Desulfocurvibacter africanus subsp. africanus str. Walvis Bay]|uniref:DUF1622 domain-containing protein n=2 Tax=Desulfocurvibacter africanus TaxID=873 RepID=F3YVI9_DESAF|nr:protein of unknown function DUF1622 [Desulfocurvibacter africanus subsp. africanus str. Walvis Bay]